MNEKELANQWLKEGLIAEDSFNKLNEHIKLNPFSVHQHLQIALYLGVTFLAAGLGLLIYKNISNIGHITVVSATGILSLACFVYCLLQSKPFTFEKTVHPSVWFDYILLLGSLLLVTFIGYLQFEFKFFGERYGLATFIPCVILFTAAYYFDHLGVLSMAIVLLGSWMGIAVAPVDLFQQNDFSSSRFIYTAFLLAIILGVASYLTHLKQIKKHFYFTYLNFAVHIGFVAALCGLFTMDMWWLWTPVIGMMFYSCYKYAMQQKSFYILLVSGLYSYIALSYLITRLVIDDNFSGVSAIYFLLFYYILSAIMLIKYLRQFKKEIHNL